MWSSGLENLAPPDMSQCLDDGSWIDRVNEWGETESSTYEELNEGPASKVVSGSETNVGDTVQSEKYQAALLQLQSLINSQTNHNDNRETLSDPLSQESSCSLLSRAMILVKTIAENNIAWISMVQRNLLLQSEQLTRELQEFQSMHDSATNAMGRITFPISQSPPQEQKKEEKLSIGACSQLTTGNLQEAEKILSELQDAGMPQYSEESEFLPQRDRHGLEEKHFICQVTECGKRFKYASNWRRHRFVHATLKPFRCPFQDCSREYARSANLKNHLRAKHDLVVKNKKKRPR